MPLSIYKVPRKPRTALEIENQKALTLRALQQRSLTNLEINKPGSKPSATKKRKKRK